MFQEPTSLEWLVFYWLLGSILVALIGMVLIAIVIAFCKLVKAAYNEILFQVERRRYHREGMHQERM